MDLSDVIGLQFECRQCGAARAFSLAELVEPQFWNGSALRVCRHWNNESAAREYSEWKKLCAFSSALAEASTCLRNNKLKIPMRVNIIAR
jgi:hypothetical protein